MSKLKVGDYISIYASGRDDEIHTIIGKIEKIDAETSLSKRFHYRTILYDGIRVNNKYITWFEYNSQIYNDTKVIDRNDVIMELL